MSLSRMPTRVLIAAMLATLTCLATQAQQAQPADENTEELKTGSITGSVVSDSGQPLAGAGVFLSAVGTATQGRATTTDSEGNFQVSGLDAALYAIFARVPGYVPLPRNGDDSAQQPTYYRLGDKVRVVQIKGGVITGAVTNSLNEPVVKVGVRATMIRDANGQPLKYGTADFNERETDDRGVYRIYGLSPGTYLISAGGGTRFGSFIVNAYDTNAPTYAPSATRDTATEYIVHGGDEISGVDIRYRAEPGRVVSGTANGPTVAGPYAFYTITLSSGSNGGPQWISSTFQPVGGRGFSFSGVVDGEYDLTAQSSSSADFTISEPRHIKVKGADVTGIELTTKPLASIAGRVMLEPSKAPECKGKRRPLFAETLVLATRNEKDSAGSVDFMRFTGAQVAPDKEGSFTLRNVRSGQYTFNSRFFARYWYLQMISLQPAVVPAAKGAAANQRVDATHTWTTVKLGDRVSNLNVTLAEGAASLRGQLTAPAGQKLPAMLVIYLVPAERDKAEEVLRFFVTAATGDGSFALNNLAPGRYWLLARPASDEVPGTEPKLRLPEAAATRTKLRRDAEATKTELELKPCQNVSEYKLPWTPTTARVTTTP